MPTDPRRPVLAASLAAALLLGGCAGGGEPDGSSAASARSTHGGSGAGSAGQTDQRSGTKPGTKSGKKSGGASAAAGASSSPDPGPGSDPSSDDTSDPSPDPQPDNGGGSDPSGAVLEVPVAAAPSVDGLGDLLGDADRPLVTSPLPRAASARGRLVGGFPAALRPAPGSRVETSSVSPADDRLQVALVGSTAMAPGRVLLAYRTRLGRRGMVEQATAPQTAPGSQAAALQRGRSVVTITVTRQGSRTSYSVMASLHTGPE
ncbi:hypothetical protein ASC64_11500 [Nocardioides sp. Root122]|uniref:hypothetical protein n=1 Tax=Nocardioides TaxID=1839 RepID=UPI000703874E|nr:MULTISPECIES: hypothetical protein [Nocardioides]KQV67823.1 hypothetical protein ASC64_11500 [Nocardioides sp. Root122]MCK9826114.1 hypothetical protein [Nocardioides cavernae]